MHIVYIYLMLARVGPRGPRGQRGRTGPTGPTGARGPTGAQGPIGLQGIIGPAGLNGSTGATGPAGLAGIDGATGPVGPSGTAGLMGATGSMGPTGPAGAGSVLEYVQFRGLTGMGINTNVIPISNSATGHVAFTVDTIITAYAPNGNIGGNGLNLSSEIANQSGSIFAISEGRFIVEYETSLSSSGAIGIYTSLPADNFTNFTLVPDSVAGSSVPNTWISGTYSFTVPIGQGLYFVLSPVSGSLSITDAGGSGQSIIRVSIKQVS